MTGGGYFARAQPDYTVFEFLHIFSVFVEANKNSTELTSRKAVGACRTLFGRLSLTASKKTRITSVSGLHRTLRR